MWGGGEYTLLPPPLDVHELISHLFSVLAEIALENGESMLPHHLVVQTSSADSSTLSMGEGSRGDNEGEDEIVLDGVGEVEEVRIFICSDDVHISEFLITRPLFEVLTV